ncbi:MAG TPA: aspartate--tRNA ligase [Candidatus Pacearchaeota archaeon]|nr:aspartate--tRNA ligase [Candidatus Pacearchaeota archaeon]
MKRTLIAETANCSGQKIKLNGWVNSYRDHGGVIFIDLRDRSGIVQVVCSKELPQIELIRPEWVLEVIGEVKDRPAKMVNEKIATGRVEVKAESVAVLSAAEIPPFDLKEDGYQINEEIRLKYRYLDLRRPRLQRNLTYRHKVFSLMRQILDEQGFREVDTPILARSTPEGARDFVVPARQYPGSFYALPQSPQQYKQMLMVGGLERYFQIARCFRDEDFRADRQAEFLQLDLEMSFVEQEDILSLIENLFRQVIEKVFPEKKIQKFPFPRLPYDQAMKEYKSDRPDLRKDQDPQELAFAFVVDFPMFEKQTERKGWAPVHHPFTRPQTDSIDQVKQNPGDIKAFQYDLVLNGSEIGGGSLRIYRPDMLQAVFQVLGHQDEEIRNNFGHLLEAFQYGVPPHGGIAIGLDRFLSIVLDEKNIREVIPFPKTEAGRELMTGAPAPITPEQLKELNLEFKKKK